MNNIILIQKPHVTTTPSAKHFILDSQYSYLKKKNPQNEYEYIYDSYVNWKEPVTFNASLVIYDATDNIVYIVQNMYELDKREMDLSIDNAKNFQKFIENSENYCARVKID